MLLHFYAPKLSTFECTLHISFLYDFFVCPEITFQNIFLTFYVPLLFSSQWLHDIVNCLLNIYEALHPFHSPHLETSLWGPPCFHSRLNLLFSSPATQLSSGDFPWLFLDNIKVVQEISSGSHWWDILEPGKMEVKWLIWRTLEWAQACRN